MGVKQGLDKLVKLMDFVVLYVKSPAMLRPTPLIVVDQFALCFKQYISSFHVSRNTHRGKVEDLSSKCTTRWFKLKLYKLLPINGSITRFNLCLWLKN